MNIPNLLTIVRILLTPLLVIFLINERFDWAFVVFAAAGITDGLDGFLARVMKQKTRVGAILDPIADKALLASAYITLAVIGLVPNWLAVTVISRDLIIVFGVLVLLLFQSGIEIRPTVVSKLTTLFQLFTIFIVLFTTVTHMALDRLLFCCYIVTAILTIASGLDYLYKGILMLGND